jgi:hypothetical protein
VFCPGKKCNGATFAAYPFNVVGPVAGFVGGTALVCGGARSTYAGCEFRKPGANFCDRNADCVTTAGGSLWCTGPKIADCFHFDRYVT